jgi:hypothetical protein
MPEYDYSLNAYSVKILHDRLIIVARKVANMRKVHLSIPIADKINSALNAIAPLECGLCRVLVLRVDGSES